MVLVAGVGVALRWPVMSLDGLVAEAGDALGRARALFGPAAFGAGFGSTPALLGAGVRVGAGVGESQNVWWGSAGSGYRLSGGQSTQELDGAAAADGAASGAIGAGGAQAASGRAGADGVVQDARQGVAAIAPATGTQAGKAEMVAHLQTQLLRMRHRLQASETRNLLLAQEIRSAGGGYGGGGMAGGAAMPAMGSAQLPMGGGGAGLSIPNLNGLLGAAHGQQHPGRGDPRLHTAMLGSGGGPAAQQAVKAALTRLGLPYVWGAKGPNAFDCSGLVKWAYAQAGITLGPDTHAQFAQGMAVAPADVTAGDAVFPSNEIGSNGPEHVMLAISPTQCVEASTSGVPVKISPMPASFQARRYA